MMLQRSASSSIRSRIPLFVSFRGNSDAASVAAQRRKERVLIPTVFQGLFHFFFYFDLISIKINLFIYDYYRKSKGWIWSL